MNKTKIRLEKILQNPLRVFYDASFDDAKKTKEILAEIPGIEQFKSDNNKIYKIVSKKPMEMRPCYEAALLTFEQEQHLFRKMNFYKHKAKILLNGSKISSAALKKIEDFLDKAQTIRNEIASSNFRLATQILKMQISFYREHSLVESMLSDAYLDVIKAVDYFNWTLGNRFNTYATWVIKKNFFRDSKQKIKYAEKFEYLDEEHVVAIESKNFGFEEEKQYEVYKKIVQKLLKLFEKDSKYARHLIVIERYFGINGDRQTLEEISHIIGCTKERVRQLKSQGLRWLKDKIVASNIDLEQLSF